jgi:hypothetical protein
VCCVGIELAGEQMAEQDVSCLPTIKVSDIPKTVAQEHTSSVLAGMESNVSVVINLCSVI